MRRSRFFLDQELGPGDMVELDERAAHYANQVMRLRAGNGIVLFDGSGKDFDAVLTRCDRRRCSARITGIASNEQAAPLALHLGIGISRGERMDFAVQKSVELGVGSVTPLLTERSVVALKGERMERRLAHWRAIVVSACEQSGRSRLPTLHAPAPLAEWLRGHPGGLVLYHRAPDSLATLPPPENELNLLIGPEGGLSDLERELAAAQGFRGVRLGPRVLRTETAPLAALAAIQVLWGDFR